jgi:hypothetical protein
MTCLPLFDEPTTETEPYLYQCQACGHLCTADECQCLGATGTMLICPECGGDAEIKSWEELTEYQI